MAVLTDSDRKNVWADFMADLSRSRTALALTKPELKAAIDAVDDWVDTNAPLYNAALPLAARTNLTAKQKAQLLMYVVRRRFEVS